ncbi:HD-GYP domain-containing protein [bacterium]|nr:HD-GYP domain-containing protein [bacterium]
MTEMELGAQSNMARSSRFAFLDKARFVLARTDSHFLDVHAGIVTSLLIVMAQKNEAIFHHCSRVSGYALPIAHSMKLAVDKWDILVVSALLHDIGKVGISDRILHKQGTLTETEWCLIKQHSGHGVEILSPYQAFRPILPVIRHHHEHYDGQGYPDHLRGEEIPLHARIISVADMYDAMVTDRPYRQACSHSCACAEIARVAGSQLDPVVSDHFLNISKSYQPEHQLLNYYPGWNSMN